MTTTTNVAWAILWESKAGGDAINTFLSKYAANKGDIPPYVSGNNTMLFASRNEARDFIKERFSDNDVTEALKGTPLEWKMPKPVQVAVTVTDAQEEPDQIDPSTHHGE